MKKLLFVLITSFSLMTASGATMAGGFDFGGWYDFKEKFSDHYEQKSWGWKKHKDWKHKDWKHKDWKWKHKDWKDKDPKKVPEIDAAGAGLALALMGGLVAIVRERRRKLS